LRLAGTTNACNRHTKLLAQLHSTPICPLPPYITGRVPVENYVARHDRYRSKQFEIGNGVVTISDNL